MTISQILQPSRFLKEIPNHLQEVQVCLAVPTPAKLLRFIVKLTSCLLIRLENRDCSSRGSDILSTSFIEILQNADV